jgi:hypothetical protein
VAGVQGFSDSELIGSVSNIKFYNDMTTTTEDIIPDKSTNNISVVLPSLTQEFTSNLGGTTANGISTSQAKGSQLQSGHALIGTTIGQIDFNLACSGTCSGTLEAGVWTTASQTPDVSFGTLDFSTVPSTLTTYSFNSNSHTLAVGDVIGVSCIGCSGTPQAQMSISSDNDPNEVFAESNPSNGHTSWLTNSAHDVDYTAYSGQLSSATSTTGVIGTGIQSPNLSFTDSNLPDNTDDFSVGSWVKLDTTTATFTTNNPDLDGVLVDNSNNNVCDTPSNRETSGITVEISSGRTGSTLDCKFGFFEFPISGIPSNAVVTNVDFEFSMYGVSSPRNCDYVDLGTVRPSTASDSDLFNEILLDNDYTDNDSTCAVDTGSTQSVTLGGNANSDVQSAISNGVFYFGVKYNDLTVPSSVMESTFSSEEGTITPDPTLVVTYSVPPDNTKLLGLNDVTFNVGTDSASVTTLVTGTSTNEVVWDESTATNASFSGNTITGTGGTWGTAAKSIATYSTSDGMYVEMERPSGSYSVMFGFGNGAHTGGTYHFSTLDYGINMGGDVYESNSNVCNSCANLGAGTYKVNIATDGTITYWYKSPTGSYTTPFYTSSTTASGDYSVRVHIHTTYSALAEVTAQGLIPSTIISASGLTDNTSTPQHYTFTRSANDWEIYQNGAQIYQNGAQVGSTVTDTTSLGAGFIAGSSGNMETTATYQYSSMTGSQTITNGSYEISAQKIANSNSELVGKTIGRIDVPMALASGTGTVTAGVFDSSGNTLHTFGTRDITTISTSTNPYNWYSFTGTSGYTLSVGEYVGVKIGSSGTLYIPHRDSGSQYDGSNSHWDRWNGSWSSSFTNLDQNIKLYVGNPPVADQYFDYTTHIDGMIDEYFINSDVLTASEI